MGVCMHQPSASIPVILIYMSTLKMGETVSSEMLITTSTLQDITSNGLT
jgi:hypothetical protein